MKRYIGTFFLGAFSLSGLFAQDAGAYFQQGEKLFLQNKPLEAVSFLEKAVDAEPSNVTAGLYLAMTYEQLGKTDNAIAAYRRILPVGGEKTALIAFNMGNAYFSKGTAGFAEQFYTQAIDADPGYAPAYLNRANARVKTGAFKEAIPDYELYLALEPASPKRPQIERLISLLEEEILAEERRGQTSDVTDEAIKETRAEMEKRKRLTDIRQ